METNQFKEEMKKQPYIFANSETHLHMHELSLRARKITARLNNKYRSPKKIRALFSDLIGNSVDESFVLFPPFYTDCGIDIQVGKNVFINSGCCFQDQGGIEIGDGALIGQQVVIATLNHNEDPTHRADMIPQAVHIGKNVWIGGKATILPGVKIGDNSIIGAGSVVTRDIPQNSIAVGNPARVIREIKIKGEYK